MPPHWMGAIRAFHHTQARSPQSVKTKRDYDVEELLCLINLPCIQKPKGREGQLAPQVTGCAYLMLKRLVYAHQEHVLRRL